MHVLIKHVRVLLIAVTVLALSAGLAFGATPPAASTGLANAAAHAGKTVPVEAGDETAGEDDETVEEDEDTEDVEDGDETEVEDVEDVEDAEDLEDAEDVGDAEEAGDTCTTDPTLATPEELDALNHGAIVCWAAHQAEWPEWFRNHGAFVRCWAHQGKADAGSCTEDPNVVVGTDEEPTADELSASHGNGKGHAKAKGKSKHHE